MTASAPSPPPLSDLRNAQVARLLGLYSGIELSHALEVGLPPSSVTVWAAHLQLPRPQALRHLGLSASTLSRRRRKGHLLALPATRRLYALASLTNAAEAYFEDAAAAQRWLITPRATLGGLTPLETADEAGGSAAETMLRRLEQGVYS